MKKHQNLLFPRSITAIVLAVGGLIGPPALAQSDYAVIRTGTVGGGNNVKVHGINSLGQAVGEITIASVVNAFIWLPEDAYGLDAGMNLLDNSQGGFNGSAAHDINDVGVVVGRLTATVGAYPYVWDLSGSFSSGTINAANLTAFDVNNDANPLIVGGDGAGGDATSVGVAGFVYNLGTTTLTTLASSDSANKKPVALGISDTISSAYRIGGLSSCSGLACGTNGCNSQVDGQYWGASSTAAELNAIGTCSLLTARCVGYAVNNDLTVIGYGQDPNDLTGGSIARRRATTWQSGPTSTPTVLGRLDSSDQTEAFDIRGTVSSGPMEIVGWSTAAGDALLWRWNGSSWDLVELNSVSCTAGVMPSGLERARAINANGWIAGDTSGAGWVLIPWNDYRTNYCAADLAGSSLCPDGVVDVFDLFALLSNWNTSGLGADLASSTSIVDVFDLFVLLSAWNCHIGLDPESLTLEDEVTGAGLIMDDWDDFEAVMQDEEATEKDKENYKCWMMNYLTGCTTCPPCPDDDPYGE